MMMMMMISLIGHLAVKSAW